MKGSRNNIGQLKEADSATASEDRGYAHDTAWNLNYRTNNTTLQTFTVNGKNELTGSPSPYGATSYDDNGNLILSHNEGRFYEYDDENQLVAVQRTAGLHTYKTTFAYDGKLRLRLLREYRWEASGGEEESLIQENGAGPLADPPGEGSWVLLSETRYVYDGMLVIQERDGNNTPTVTYTRGNDLSGSREGAGGIGGLLARSHGYSSGTWSTHNYYHADGNGNVTYLVDSSQSLAASYRYDPFGNTLSSSGSLASANTYRFSSKMIHANTSLYYYGYRWYAPEVQRWGNRDPLGERGGINLYTYIYNSPSRYVDPFGFASICVDPNCAGVDLSRYTYVAEEEPHPPGTREPPKVPRQLPNPGECVDADAVYEPGKATKTTNCGGGRITCKAGKPEFKYCPCLPAGIRGDGHVWNAGEQPPARDRLWPSPHLPPYRDRSPVETQPPLEPFPEPPPDPVVPPVFGW